MDFAICIKNDGYPASLELRKIYQTVPDEQAAAHGFIRVIDESSENYLYPEEYFVSIELPKAAVEVFSLIVRTVSFEVYELS